jgi:hypothetical protein
MEDMRLSGHIGDVAKFGANELSAEEGSTGDMIGS